uniref:Uncharacterized protein n=1 Tax=Romanomermis culicivorax TaxID=13658 RepID=A0A915HQ23_ROMCU
MFKYHPCHFGNNTHPSNGHYIFIVGGIGSSKAAIHLFQVAEYTCKVVFCQAPYSAQSQVDRPRIDVTYLDWKSYEVNDVRMKFMRYMSKEHDSNLPLDDQLYLVIDSESLIIELKRNAINDFNVRPLMHNWATNAHVPCQKRVCTEDDEHVSSCYSGKSKEKISGVDCFTWQYEMQSVTNKLFTVQGNIANIMKLNASFEATHLVLLFPYYNDWPVREYKPVFVWYKVLSNIGGTLSIWTGANQGLVFFCSTHRTNACINQGFED